MGAFDRKNFYNLTNDKSGDFVLDPLSSDWQTFRQNLTAARLHTVNQEEEGDLPLIAFKEYGTVELWWCLAQVNNIVDPLSEVVVGTELTIPTLASISRELQNLKLSNQRATSSNVVSLKRKTV